MADRPILKPPAHRRYFVVFEQGNPHWLDLFLSRGYGHCHLLVWDDPLWLHVHPTWQITELVVLDLVEFLHPARWPEICETEAEVIEVAPEWDERMRNPWVWGPVSCVEVVKCFLGIRRFWVWTPAQLARYLRRRHG